MLKLLVIAQFYLSWLLVIIWYDASDEVGLSGVERGHEGVELLGVEGGDGLGSTALLLLTLGVPTLFLAAL